MKLGRFFWKLFLLHSAWIGLLFAVGLWLTYTQLAEMRTREVRSRLTAQARTLAISLQGRFDVQRTEELEELVQRFGPLEPDDVRVTLFSANGRVLADSEVDPAHLESRADRPEIRQALTNGWGESVRWSHAVSRRLHFVAVAIGPRDTPQGVVRVASADPPADAHGAPASRLVLSVAMVYVLGIAVLGTVSGVLWSRQMARLTTVARSLSRGELSARVAVEGHDEVAVLARFLTRVRDRLGRQLEIIDRQRRTLEGLVSQLHDGVIVADGSGRIVLVNAAAIRLLQLRGSEAPGSWQGAPVEQCVPQHHLQRLLRPDVQHHDTSMPATADPAKGLSETADANVEEIKLRVDGPSGPVSLLARAADFVLPDPRSEADPMPGSSRVGRLLVLKDVTTLDRVLQMKADFAANASHELRTPLAAVRAAAETLRGMRFNESPATAGQFLEVIERHSARMEEMVGDLLDLSRVESPATKFEPAVLDLRGVLQELRDAFADALAAKGLHWGVVIPPECHTLVANPDLLRMALRNLIDNALQFTSSDGHIRVESRLIPGQFRLDVVDDGCGIPLDEQARVFERFYQVRQARSGAQRGTGLGLSIVRHGVAAMGGTVSLESEPGRGTRVTVTIPQPGTD